MRTMPGPGEARKNTTVQDLELQLDTLTKYLSSQFTDFRKELGAKTLEPSERETDPNFDLIKRFDDFERLVNKTLSEVKSDIAHLRHVCVKTDEELDDLEQQKSSPKLIIIGCPEQEGVSRESNSQMEDNIPNSKNESLCKVCGDKASGKHYGVASCDGCRGFFKRSIRRNLEYVCKENGRCIVDVTRRNQCQACRFKKCLQVNMKRDAVQHERAPRSTQSNLHHYPLGFGGRIRTLHGSIFPNLHLHSPVLESPISAPTGLPGHYLHQNYFYPGMLGTFSKPNNLVHSGLGLPCNAYNKPMNTPLLTNVAARGSLKDDEVTSSEETTKDKERCASEENVEDKSCLELPLIQESCKPLFRPLDIPCLNLFPAENVYESAAKLLFLVIKWSRSIPSFLQLSYRDQSVLLEESWNELFVLTAAQWAFPVDESLLVSNAIAPTSRHTALEEDARRLRDIITRLTLLRVDHTEYACLKALVLFKAESRGLCEPSHVELLQDQTHVMLHEYCSQRQTSTHKGRFGKLLLTLPAVQSISKRGLEELIFRQTVGDVAIDKLLMDLSKTTH